MNKKIMLDQVDYDTYDFTIPEEFGGKTARILRRLIDKNSRILSILVVLLDKTVLTEKKVENWVYSQLERVHPCFSDRCCFKAKLKVIDNKITVHAVVVDKFLLDEYYRSKKAKILYAGPLNSRVAFNMNPSKFDKTTTGIVVASITALLILSFFPILQSVNKLQNNKMVAKNELNQINIDSSREVTNPIGINNSIELNNHIVSILESLKKNGAEITNFEYGLAYCDNDEIEKVIKIKISIYGMPPESTCKILPTDAKYSIGIVNYNNGIPEYDLDISIPVSNQVTNQACIEKQMNFTSIKEVLLKIGGTPICENFDNPLFCAEIPISLWNEFIENMEMLSNTENFSISHISASLKSSKLINLELRNQDTQSITFPKGLACLFKQNKPLIKKSKNVPLSTSLPVIGKTYTNNGSCIVFYKTEKGHVISETRNEVKK